MLTSWFGLIGVPSVKKLTSMVWYMIRSVGCTRDCRCLCLNLNNLSISTTEVISLPQLTNCIVRNIFAKDIERYIYLSQKRFSSKGLVVLPLALTGSLERERFKIE